MQQRRHFLKHALSLGAMTATGGLSRLGILNAITQPTGSYRALVCVFLYGGNDSNNLVVPLDTTGYGNYKKVRGGLALDAASLLPLDKNKQFGLHPQMSELIALAPRLAVVANVGTLVQPTTRDQYLKNTVSMPGNLFSHSDQQGEWQTAIPSGLGTTGWAGRLADQMHLQNYGTYPTFVSVAGNATMGLGASTHPGAVSPGATPGLQGFGTDAASQARLAALKAIVDQDSMKTDSGAVLLRNAAQNMKSSLTDADLLNTALKSSQPINTTFPATSLGNQLLQIARLIQVRGALQMNRQIFFCSIGGFDTHTAQLADQDNLFNQLSPALAAFYQATVELNVADQVTTFTESDFSRTLQPNSNGGTDHAWGSHHMVLGGGVKGASVYGNFPTLQLNGPDDAGGEGRWIPTTSVDQYGATLAQWFGLPASQLATVFPNINNFKSKDVGFLG